MNDKQEKVRAKRNKTITLTAEDRQELISQVVEADSVAEAMASGSDIIVHGDMKEALQHIPDHTADLIILDPPYNLQRRFDDSKFQRTTDERYEEYLRSWMPAVCRKLKPNGSLYLCGDWHCTSVMQRILSEHLTIINRITWQREKGRGAARNWKNSMEDIWYAVADKDHYTFNLDAVKQRRIVRAPYRDSSGTPKDWAKMGDARYRDTCPGNLWDDISVPFWSMSENTDHPTQKPEKLFAKLILASSNPGDVILDPFLGSGTTAAVARKLGRRFVGIDMSLEYCLLALKRLQMAETDTTIQGYEDGVFWERNTNEIVRQKRDNA